MTALDDNAAATRGPVVEAIEAAAVGLLDPLVCGSDVDWVPALRARVEVFIRCASAGGLDGLAYCGGLVLSVLATPRDAGAEPDRALVESWAATLIAFCAGQADAHAREEWISGLRRWPGLDRRLTPKVVAQLDARLVADARALDHWREESRRAGRTDPADPLHAPQAQVQGGPPGTSPETTLAADELALLADACDELQRECGPMLDAWARDDSGRASHTDLADGVALCAERFGHIANALGFVGLGAVAEIFATLSVRLEALAANPAGAAPDSIEALRELPQAWALALRDPTGPAYERAVARHEQAGGCDPAQSRRATAQWRAMRLVESRPTELHRGLAAEGIGTLTIADETDPEVVEQLLRELPALADVLSARVEALVGGDRSSIEPARRAAHTLKGAANTAGISAIATLTHALEDLLMLVERSPGTPAPALGDTLVEAADTLSAMVDTVLGRGAVPASMNETFASIVRWVEALSDARAAPPTNADMRADAPIDRLDAPEPARSEASLETEADCEAAATEASVSEARSGEVPSEEPLRISAAQVDRLVEASTEASIALAQVQAQLDELTQLRRALRQGAQRTRDLAVEAGRLVGASRRAPPAGAGALAQDTVVGGFDALEMTRYDDFDMLANRIAEVGADGQLLDAELGAKLDALSELVGRLERAQADVRESALGARMIAVESIAGRLQRAARQAARLAGKAVTLRIDGRDQRFEARLLQALVEPLGHLIRNAVDHGIETAAQREAVGKSPAGHIELRFERVGGGQLRVSCVDDGSGPDLEKIGERAREMGLAPVDLSDPVELANVLCAYAFSTRGDTTQLSGRGLGLGLVAQAAADLRGGLEVRAEPGRGLAVSLTVPLGFAAVGALVVRSPSHVLALSVASIQSIVPAVGIRTAAGGGSCIGVGDRDVPLLRLDELLGLPAGSFAPEPSEQGEPDVVLIVANPLTEVGAVLVPSPGAARQVIAQPLPSYMPALGGVEGATVLGDGSVAPVMDLRAWLASRRADPARAAQWRAAKPERPRCLVVDDSVSVRRATQGLVEDLGLVVDAASDGIDALAVLERHVPSIAVIDLEMPRMNGIELTRALRARAETAEMPIIMITSRSSERHREHAMEAGVTHFLGKPYVEDALAALIHRSLERG